MGTLGNLFINGNFQSDLWNHLPQSAEEIECPVWRQTFAADRWKIRYAHPAGAAVTQARLSAVPEDFPVNGGLEIRGTAGVSENVFLGQRIESAEAVRYRRRLFFSAWVWTAQPAEIKLHCGTAREPDIFGDAFNDRTTLADVQLFCNQKLNGWQHVETELEVRNFSRNGLSVELEFPATLFRQAGAGARVAGLRLSDFAQRELSVERPAQVETELAARFFQRYTSARVNSLGRALVVNQHELHFQFMFPPMRIFPACTLPQANEDLRVFDFEGQPQEGFAYDVTYRARGSLIVRATKENHGLRDGYLSFVGSRGAILLDAEL